MELIMFLVNIDQNAIPSKPTSNLRLLHSSTFEEDRLLKDKLVRTLFNNSTPNSKGRFEESRLRRSQ